jgi:hypothetical protein
MSAEPHSIAIELPGSQHASVLYATAAQKQETLSLEHLSLEPFGVIVAKLP